MFDGICTSFRYTNFHILYVIKTQMDEVEIKSCNKCGTIIKMTKLVGVEE